MLSSHDLVAADAAAARAMGFAPREIGYLANAERAGLGSIDGEVVGDEVEPQRFARPRANAVGFVHKKLRASPLKPLLFDTPLIQVLARLALIYNTPLWYRFSGKRAAERLIATSWYGAQSPYRG